MIHKTKSLPIHPLKRALSGARIARLRFRQGRPISQVIGDIQRAGRNDVFIQVEDGRYVVRGTNAREHIIEPTGEHVTSIRG